MFRSMLLFVALGLTLPFYSASTADLVVAQEIETEPGFDDDWEADIDLALAHAKEDNKRLLLLFTGSDWCPPCIRLEQEVLSKDSFIKQAEKNFTLVKMDFPQDQTKVPAQMLQTNQKWMKQLGVEGFPTIVLIDVEGQPFGFIGYTPGSPDSVLEEIQNRLTAHTDFHQQLEKARAQQGDALAQGLDAALESLGLEMAQAHYTSIVDEILEIDQDNHLGLREKYRGDLDSQARKAILADILLMVRLQPPEKVLQFMDALQVEVPLTAQLEATLLQIRFDLQRQMGNPESALETMDRLIELYSQDDDAWQRMVVQKFFYMSASTGQKQAMEMLETALAAQRPVSRLRLAQGDFQTQFGDMGQAITTYDKALVGAIENPDLYAEITEAKADALANTDRLEAAILILDAFAVNDRFPVDLRARLLVHKAILLRQQNNLRAALLSENKALGLIETPKRKAELQRLIDEMRAAFSN